MHIILISIQIIIVPTTVKFSEFIIVIVKQLIKLKMLTHYYIDNIARSIKIGRAVKLLKKKIRSRGRQNNNVQKL